MQKLTFAITALFFAALVSVRADTERDVWYVIDRINESGDACLSIPREDRQPTTACRSDDGTIVIFTDITVAAQGAEDIAFICRTMYVRIDGSQPIRAIPLCSDRRAVRLMKNVGHKRSRELFDETMTIVSGWLRNQRQAAVN